LEKEDEKLILSIIQKEDGLSIEFNIFWKKGTWKDLFEIVGLSALGTLKGITKAIPKEPTYELIPIPKEMKEGEKVEDSKPEQPV